MQQARALIEQTDSSPEMKSELVATYDKIMETFAESCPQEKRDDLGNAVAEAIIALARLGQRNKDRLYVFARSRASMFLSSNGHADR
jgi:hypothetical protein